MNPPPAQLRIVWVGLLVGVLTYTGLVFGLMRAEVLSIGALDAGVMNLVGPAVLVYMAGAVLLRRKLVAQVPTDADPAERARRYGEAAIIGWALIEGGGLGVISFALMTDSTTWVLAGGGATAALLVLTRPGTDDPGTG